MEDLSGVSSDLRLNVLLDNGGEGVLVSDVLYPLWQLRVPDGCVSTDELVVGGCPVDKSVQASKVEVSLRRLNCIPFATKIKRISNCMNRRSRNLPVLRGHLSKVGFDNLYILLVVQQARISAGTEVLLA